ncbi:MAG: NAD(P)/FAD-dependent oxidoreductase [Muribaculaceae bacterium]|nr:NAD(P)/FAD-dependent oxidoreductase [Muribaculaceae bacterium]
MSDQRVIIIGAGLGGLMCGAILAREGYRVTVVEKNAHIGGCLQSYHRCGTVFDTGMHIFGGMAHDGNIRLICDYLGITDQLTISDLDKSADVEVFVKNNDQSINFNMHRRSFVNNLAEIFPDQKDNLERYLDKVDAVMDCMDLFHLRRCSSRPHSTSNPDFLIAANEFVDKYIDDYRLRALMSVFNILYAGEYNITPAYLHSSITSIFLNGACRIVGGYQNLAKALADVITGANGQIHTLSHVSKIILNDGRATQVVTNRGKVFEGDYFIYASPVTSLCDMVGDNDVLSRNYRLFMASRHDSLSSFIVNIKLKKNTIPYNNRIGFYLEDYSSVWNYDAVAGIDKFMYMTPPTLNQGEYAETLNIVAPMSWQAVKQWENVVNRHCDPSYENFKNKVTNAIIDRLENIYPHIKDSIEYIDSATPLTIHDFTGVRGGAMCGLRKNCADPMPFIPLHTKIPNLLLTGQSVNMHGFCGVTLTAIQTCEAILGRDYLINKINPHETTD